MTRRVIATVPGPGQSGGCGQSRSHHSTLLPQGVPADYDAAATGKAMRAAQNG
ncbi:Uncharacterised protein [Mycobacterium tuberculosis]|nr:Uncharacterised protein [Mycobacterium tuberculosis]